MLNVMIIKRNIIICLVFVAGFQIYAMDLSNKPNEADLKELERLCEKRRESLAKERGMKFLADKQYVPIASISIKEPIKKERSILDGLDLSKIPLGMAMAINEALMEEAWERRNREKAYEKK